MSRILKNDVESWRDAIAEMWAGVDSFIEMHAAPGRRPYMTREKAKELAQRQYEGLLRIGVALNLLEEKDHEF